jgi:hypothetical protein
MVIPELLEGVTGVRHAVPSDPWETHKILLVTIELQLR